MQASKEREENSELAEHKEGCLLGPLQERGVSSEERETSLEREFSSFLRDYLMAGLTGN